MTRKITTALALLLVAATATPALAAKPPKPPKPPNPAPPAPGQLTLTASAGVIVFGENSTLTANLAGLPQVADQEIGLRQAPFPFTRFRDLATARTDAAGNAAFTVTPTANTRYVALAKSTNPNTTSAEIDVLVKFRVSIRVGRTAITGNASPASDGAPVQLQKKVRGGYRTVKTGRLFDAGADRSQYRFKRPGRGGVYRIRVPADPDNLTGTSSAKRISG